MKNHFPSWFSHKPRIPTALAWILAAGFLHALIYVFLVPPWQHYDEPGHFEFAWLMANRPTLPVFGDFDENLIDRISDSMAARHFWEYQNTTQPVAQPGTLPFIGVHQVDWQFLYYWFAAIPLWILSGLPIEIQLYAARLVSVFMFLGTLGLAYACLSECTRPGHPLRWMIPLGMALFPSFVEEMSALNNDAGATVLFTAFLWPVVRMMVKGPTVRNVIAASALAVACIWMKSTIFVALPLLPIALVFSFVRGKGRRIVWGGLAAGALLFVLLGFQGGDALHWARNTAQEEPTRSAEVSGPVGKTAFHFALDADAPTARLTQVLPAQLSDALQDRVFTVGAWIWCSQPVTGRFLSVNTGLMEYSNPVACEKKPAFFSWRVPAGRFAHLLTVSLQAGLLGHETLDVYYDGVVLIPGTRPNGAIPSFSSGIARDGTWGDRRFMNFVRNSSAVTTGPRAATWLDVLGKKAFGFPLSMLLQFTWDWEANGTYQYRTVMRLVDTFWGYFGWGNVPIFGGRITCLILAGGACVLLLAALVFVIRNRKKIPWAIAFVMGLALLGVWGLTFFRVTGTLASTWWQYSVARYAFPVQVLTLLPLGIGLREIKHWVGRWLPVPDRYWRYALIGAAVVYALTAMASQWMYYSRF